MPALWLVREVAGDLRVRGADGPVLIGRAHAAVVATTVLGDVRVDEAVHGPLHLDSASGQIEVGLSDTAAPRLEVTTEAGNVYRSLDTFQTVPRAEAVAVWARTVSGDIVVRRCLPS
ncbi:DUF4097 family beta strand repeat-containing protein [Streptomyces sp. PU-14G]|uniref:DUF4097 family beta strand repeat-containing protein n=1 Tax=Streptomyces sp. PU-14G TaxID=2800808 RepID=UPI0034DF6C6A